jgi:aspartyl-tRNA(Asn)/glutamyl-tRNA(Gln) amidotransferase subunit C
MRDDEVRPGLGQEVALENAPDGADGYFRVPKVIGG